MKKILFILFCFFLCPSLFAQTINAEPEKKSDFETMVQKTLLQDIETASYYELVDWCRLLNLAESGDRQALIERLKAYFKVESSQKKEIVRRIEVKSARSADYFTLDEIEENYILIRGGVVVSLIEEKNATKHTIKAERILYNETANLLTASGEVEYTRQLGDKIEVFRAENFYFDVSDWEGVLYFAEGERAKEVEKQPLIFSYRGDTISRNKDNSIILENGRITSSQDRDNPNYKITASRLIVFGPGEWAVENAVLYLGHIPILYLPFFYYTADELFFHPAVGFKVREGAYWQNTIYLIGQEKKEDDILSFLQLEELNEQDYEKKIEGLFLRPVQKKTTTKTETSPNTLRIKHLKIFADLYSRLGFFTGLSLDISPQIKLFGGLAFSRSIFYNPILASYTPFYPFENGTDYWNRGNLFGLLVPFRFGLETEFDLTLGIIQLLSGRFYLFSDPFFGQDFYSREESQNWGKLIGFDLSSLTQQPTQSSVVGIGTPKPWTSIVWSLNIHLNFAPVFKTPFFSAFSFNPLGLSLDWSSRTVQNPTSDPIINADPARMFFYPQRFTFPNLGLLVSGTILQYAASNALKIEGKTSGTSEQDSVLEPPSIFKATTKAPEAEQEFRLDPRLIEPEPKGELPVNRIFTLFSTNETYSLNLTLKGEHLFDHQNWLTASAIDYALLSSLWTHTGKFLFNYQFGFLNNLFNLQGNFNLQEKYRVTYTEEQGYQQTDADKAATSLDLTKGLILSLSPLQILPEFSRSKISYSLRWDIFDIYFDAIENNFYERLFDFSKDTVNQQQIQADFVFQPEDKPNFLRLLASLPPVLGRVYAELNFHLSIFQTIVIFEYKQALDETWKYEPLFIREKVSWANYFTLTASYKHDLENNEPLTLEGTLDLFKYIYNKKERYLLNQQLSYDFSVDSLTKCQTTLDLWDLKMTLFLQRMRPLSPLGTPGLDYAFLLYKLYFNYNLSTEDLYFWKNRIALKTSLNTFLDIDFQKHVDSKFTLDWQTTLKIYRFLDVVFKVEVYNNNIFRYIPYFVEAVNKDPLVGGLNLTPVNLFEDLLKSFNFFNIEDRYDSFFKLKSLGLELIHYLDDWIFKISFTGNFQNQLVGGILVYNWVPIFSFSVKWLPIPQIERKIKGNTEGLQL